MRKQCHKALLVNPTQDQQCSERGGKESYIYTERQTVSQGKAAMHLSSLLYFDLVVLLHWLAFILLIKVSARFSFAIVVEHRGDDAFDQYGQPSPPRVLPPPTTRARELFCIGAIQSNVGSIGSPCLGMLCPWMMPAVDAIFLSSRQFCFLAFVAVFVVLWY